MTTPPVHFPLAQCPLHSPHIKTNFRLEFTFGGSPRHSRLKSHFGGTYLYFHQISFHQLAISSPSHITPPCQFSFRGTTAISSPLHQIHFRRPVTASQPHIKCRSIGQWPFCSTSVKSSCCSPHQSKGTFRVSSFDICQATKTLSAFTIIYEACLNQKLYTFRKDASLSLIYP